MLKQIYFLEISVIAHLSTCGHFIIMLCPLPSPMLIAEQTTAVLTSLTRKSKLHRLVTTFDLRTGFQWEADQSYSFPWKSSLRNLENMSQELWGTKAERSWQKASSKQGTARRHMQTLREGSTWIIQELCNNDAVRSRNAVYENEVRQPRERWEVPYFLTFSCIPILVHF